MVRRASFGLALAFFLVVFFFDEDALLLEDVVVGVETGGGVLPWPSPPWLRLPMTHSPASSARTTRPTSHPRERAARGRRRRSRWPGGAIGCSSTSERRSWRSLYSSMRSLPSSPRASA